MTTYTTQNTIQANTSMQAMITHMKGCKHLTDLSALEEYHVFQLWEQTHHPRLERAIIQHYTKLANHASWVVWSQIQRNGLASKTDKSSVENMVWQEMFQQMRRFEPTHNSRFHTFVSKSLMRSVYRTIHQELTDVHIKRPGVSRVVQIINARPGACLNAIKPELEAAYGRPITPQKMQWLTQLANASRPMESMTIAAHGDSDSEQGAEAYAHTLATEESEDSIAELSDQAMLIQKVHETLQQYVADNKVSQRNVDIYTKVFFQEQSEGQCAEEYTMARQRVNQIILKIHAYLRKDLSMYEYPG